MGNLRLPVSLTKNEINNLKDLELTINEAQSIVDNANEQATKSTKIEEENSKLTEFDKSLKVDGVKPQNFPKTNYQKLDSKTEQTLKVFLSNVTMQDISSYEEINNSEGISSNGEPFKCFASLNGDGTLIVTPNKVISVNKKDEDNYDYTETRKEGSTLKKVSIHTVCGISNIGYATAQNVKDMRDLETFSTFFGNPRNAMNLELKGMTEQEKAQYILELNKLGIKPAEDKLASIDELAGKYTPEQLKKANEDGKLLHTLTQARAKKENGGLNKNSATILYGNNEETPRTIWFASQSANGKEQKLNMYRRAANGKYIDSSSVTFVNGQIKYQMVTIDEIEQRMDREGISVEQFNKCIAKNLELNGKIPEEAGRIADIAEKQKEQERNPNLEETEEDYPGHSSNPYA